MNFIRAIPAVAIAGALGVCLMGATNDSVSAGDVAFAPATMNILLQSVANAEAVQSDGATGDVAKLAASIQSDELAVGTQLANVASFDGIDVKTDLPKSDCTTDTFAEDQVTSLNKLISLLQAEKDSGNAPNLRDFADNAIPRLQKDLDAAKAAAK
ncbi:MAG: hypothetical protein JO322_00040 [Candidatus Eremiobacteraeota bacterium]|nr:hypothetical protein [Candidatus Eremiobacteraeota bacterium]